ncbi:MAG: RdgB/HAM1 family non-canonical purine NTP pyrophosphatase [bacterium]|nr:RdgB/HAM1 family non-canonical purine NTP pyrophosphatase [bacterium]
MKRLKVVLATGNAHKRDEIARIVAELKLPLEIVDPPQPLPEVVEDGATLEINATKKAVEVCHAMGMPALADDTGLEIDALNGEPGIYAARWAGEDCDFRKNIAKALRLLSGMPPERRTARFRTVVALCHDPDEPVDLAEGKVEGRISDWPTGGGGFGYDPIFYLPEMGRSMAELDESEKNRISHRFRALLALKGVLTR